jgi:SAM-dependent methyltransferase
MIKNKIKSIIKFVFPGILINKILRLRTAIQKFNLPKTKKIFENTDKTPQYLGIHILEELQKKYPFPPDYGYDEKSLLLRGKSRAEQILRLSGAKKCELFLELGCWDGMVSYALNSLGKNTTAIDIKSEGFDPRAVNKGVKLIQMDASDMKFENNSFDFVFSFDTFEHFSNPEQVFKEVIRVLKKGGYLFLLFEPLYMSPFGEHAYRSITVPYCQFLFDKKIINDFIQKHNLEKIDFNHVNGWSLEQYRDLWKKYEHSFNILKYNEKYDLRHLKLIRKYPSCFKSKTNYFENLTVSSIEILLRKI